MLRDSLAHAVVVGMLTGIGFAWLQGCDLDNNAKQWRLVGSIVDSEFLSLLIPSCHQVADILNDLSMFIELLSPLFPAYFVLLVCIASFCRAIVGVAGGATRAALIQHQAL